ncbi:hypothetical protein FQA39_LY12458 [Lamprigera yunnana]|nr:hypothetical protein FQA39_LY12458 [Lamprigera yunnana]
MKSSNQLYQLLNKLGVVRYSGKKNIYGLHPLIISSAVIIVTVILADCLRKLLNAILKDTIAKEIILEFLATAELCACCFELIVVADNYGVLTYGLFLFLLTLWWSNVWEDATACPYNVVEDFLDGFKPLTKTIILVASQVLGGIAVYKYVETVWRIQLAETHIGILDEECTADLAVPMNYGAIIEGTATFLCRLMSRILNEVNFRFALVLDAFFATTLVLAAFNFSGGYFNPALATSLKFGCKGNTFEEHIVVYWVGATVGSIASYYFYKLHFVQKRLEKYKEKYD